MFRWASFFFSPGGLDTLVRDLVVDDRRKISSWLNEKGTDGKLQVFLVFNLFYANNRRIETIHGKLERNFSEVKNRPFPSSKNPYLQNEAKSKTSLVKMSFICGKM